MNATETAELQRALSAHLERHGEQFVTLRQLLKEVHSMGEYPICTGVEALLGERVAVCSEYPNGILRAAVMIAHMQRSHPYKVAAYEAIHEDAKLLGYKEATSPLDDAAKAIALASKALSVIGVQVNAEACVDTRATELPVHSYNEARQ